MSIESAPQHDAARWRELAPKSTWIHLAPAR